ncbi:Uncharacterized protein dnm_019980 [Desulfonema magnum]|uniref:Uncharacterized protein n=1 Tax=Desulfonema magnum TaxID=45655 RepID=A0A975BIB2_9BACT|nr:Uncharacterized protein dnm_019980 [Desulfonema magnum]
MLTTETVPIASFNFFLWLCLTNLQKKFQAESADKFTYHNFMMVYQGIKGIAISLYLADNLSPCPCEYPYNSLRLSLADLQKKFQPESADKFTYHNFMMVYQGIKGIAISLYLADNLSPCPCESPYNSLRLSLANLQKKFQPNLMISSMIRILSSFFNPLKV